MVYVKAVVGSFFNIINTSSVFNFIDLSLEEIKGTEIVVAYIIKGLGYLFK